RRPFTVAGNHHLDPSGDGLPSKAKLIGGDRSGPESVDLFARSEEERLAGTDRGAHWLLPDAGPVVTHVALHHDLTLELQLGHPEGTGDHAVSTGDAAWLPCALHHPIAGALDRVRRTDLGAGRLITMHTHHRNRLGAQAAVHVVDVDHRVPPMGVALTAGLDA